MSLDISTLCLVATLLAALLGAMLMYFGKQESIPALDWWGYAYLLGATAVALWGLVGPGLPPTLALGLNALGFIACGMVWNAARVFHGRKPNWPGLFIGAMAWIATIVSIPAEAVQLRITIGAGIVAIYAVLTAIELGSERRKSMQRRWPAIIVPLLHGGVLMLPILLADLLARRSSPPPPTSGSRFSQLSWCCTRSARCLRSSCWCRSARCARTRPRLRSIR